VTAPAALCEGAPVRCDEIWGIDRDSPELQPINGVSLETYVQVSAIPSAGRSNVVAEDAARAGVSTRDWTGAVAGWQLRIASNRRQACARGHRYQ
jgi:hypothetical protein